MTESIRADGERVCMVTGATSGIGLATARALAASGDGVLIVSRNSGRCQDTAETIRHETGNPAVDWLAADLSSLAEVRRVVGLFHQRWDRLDVLVNNAGVSPARRMETRDGFELALGVNHLAHFLLTTLLLDTLRVSAPARVVNVTSGIYPRGRLDFADLQLRRRFSPMSAYANSKLANVVFTLELARRFEPEVLTANAMTPGLCHTNIGLEGGGVHAWGKRFADWLLRAKTPEQGADTLVWLAASDETAGMTGRLFKDRKDQVIAANAADPELGRRLWEVSEALVGDGERTADSPRIA
jgi:NAD(P)-dependent dehydrogenase (short-subunit alcohol dehydrogenase family)